jgi:hypothetical protein
LRAIAWVENHEGLVEHQWAFRDADAQATERIAIVRAAKEIQPTNPGLLDSRTPTLADIWLLQSRCQAYTHAREPAPGGCRKYNEKALERRCSLTNQDSEHLRIGASLSFYRFRIEKAARLCSLAQ